MKSYIHLYKKNSEFTAAYNGPDYKEPWLSLTEENMEVNYNKPKLTAITFNTITWVTDIPSTGGTATKGNCSFKVYAKYDNGISVDISSDATVTGELVVPSSKATTRHEAGQLTLTASYSGFTATGSVIVYQEAAFDPSAEPLTFNITSAGTINWTASNADITKTIDYNLNDGGWVSIASNTGSTAPSIDVNPGDKLQFRGNNAAYCNGNPESYSTFGGSTAGFEIEGNIMSLINSKDFSTVTTLESGFTFAILFGNCTGLTSAENLILPATTLAMGCYFMMFQNCSSLTIAPKLPATTLAMGCYVGMLAGCTSLETAPELPATQLAESCYVSMFDGCTSLETAPELPATTLAEVCYNSMFSRCTSLTTAPELPATTLTSNCYSQMFYNCTSLTTAPELPATTLADSCYNSMFYGCTNLNYIKCLATDISASNCTSNWVYGVASTGTFVKAPSMTSWTTDENGIPANWTVEVNQEPLTFNILSAGTINWTASDAAKTIDYKLNDGGWTSITSNTGSSAPTITVNSGDKLQFRGNNTQYAGSSSYNSFGGSALFEAEGNIMSLIYGDDFKNNSTISSAYTFTGLFQNCVNLISAKNLILPATTLTDSCYGAMFGYCTSLTTAPALPATTLATQCYYGMFLGCTSLTAAPALPATKLADSCYYYMFGGCTKLTTAPDLPATTLASSCYSSMFNGCTSLITAPQLPATTLADSCYGGMFYNCTSLNYIKCLATDISASNCTGSWVEGVASTGTFVKNPDMVSWTTGVNGIPANWTVEDNQEPLTFNILSAGTINWTASNTAVTKTIDYKLNNGEWTSITSNTGSSAPSITVTKGDKLQFKGNNTQYYDSSSYGYNSFSGSTALFEAEGNIMSLIYGDNFKNKLTINNYAFVELFQNCVNLVSAENLVLPATTLADNCYDSMFRDCTSLTTAPALPATKLAGYCYYQMFQNCESLVTTPVLPATTLADYCYYRMFQGCTSLITAPALPATALAGSCYQYMFSRCTSLTTAPELPATTLASYCYSSMFGGCTSLTAAPALPATTLADGCYYYMFSNCKSLITAPALPATTLAQSCYSYMFNGCTSLNYIKCLATNISAYNHTDTWVSGVAKTGTFVKASSMTSWTTGESGIPKGWTVQDA